MKKIKDILGAIVFSRVALYIIGMLVVAALIWFIGPLIGIGDSSPLSSALQRTLAITLIPALFGVGASFSNFRYRRVNRQLQETITETPKAKADAASAEEAAPAPVNARELLAILDALIEFGECFPLF